MKNNGTIGSTTRIICSRFRVRPQPPAMVMVKAHQTPLPPVEWVGPVGTGEGHPTSNQQQCNWQDTMKCVDIRQDKIGARKLKKVLR